MKCVSKENLIKTYLALVYFFLALGFSTPVVTGLMFSNSHENLYKLAVPALAVLLVAWFQKSAHGLLNQSGSFAVPGEYELRQKHLLHVNRLEWAWLILAIFGVVYAAL